MNDQVAHGFSRGGCPYATSPMSHEAGVKPLGATAPPAPRRKPGGSSRHSESSPLWAAHPLRDMRLRGRSRASTMPYEVFMHRAPIRQDAHTQLRLCRTRPALSPLGRQLLQPHGVSPGDRPDIPNPAPCGRHTLYATCAFVAGLVPRPCPTESSCIARLYGRSRAQTVPSQLVLLAYPW